MAALESLPIHGSRWRPAVPFARGRRADSVIFFADGPKTRVTGNSIQRQASTGRQSHRGASMLGPFEMMERRLFCAALGFALPAFAVVEAMGQSTHSRAADHRRGLLVARPHLAHSQSALPGGQPLGIIPRDGILYVPAGFRPDQPPPLMLLLHGA